MTIRRLWLRFCGPGIFCGRVSRRGKAFLIFHVSNQISRLFKYPNPVAGILLVKFHGCRKLSWGNLMFGECAFN